MDRQTAWELLNEYTKNPNLIKHALGVEAAMRAYAEKFGEDVETWGVVGLLHDFDYEKYPTAEDHPYRGAEILRERGLDESLIKAIISHAEYTGVPRDTLLAKTLFAVDELTGFIVAVALVRPDKKIATVKPSSSATSASARAAPTADAAMMLCPQACPISGSASYSAHTATTSGPLPKSARNAVSKPPAAVVISKPRSATSACTLAQLRCSAKASSGSA